MLYDFIRTRRDEVIARAQQRMLERALPRAAFDGSRIRIWMFLDQTVELLGRVGASDAPGFEQARLTSLTESATQQGRESQAVGLSVAQLINLYLDVHGAVGSLAAEASLPITHPELLVLNECLAGATTAAVTAYCAQRERDLAYEATERRGVLAHEMRNLLNTMTLSFAVIRQGKVGIAGATGTMLARNLSNLCALVDSSLTEVRLETKRPTLVQVSMLEFIEEIQVSAAVHAEGYGLQLIVHPVDREVAVDADWQLLASAVSSLLQNAFKFTRPKGRVSLVTRVTADRVLIDVCDECGGLPSGPVETLFRPFAHTSGTRPGLGLGLFVAQSAARASRGDLHVRDIPGRGCVFTIDLPRSAHVH